MPRHLISDAHVWINEIPTVPIYPFVYVGRQMPRHLIGDAREWINEITPVPIYLFFYFIKKKCIFYFAVMEPN